MVCVESYIHEQPFGDIYSHLPAPSFVPRNGDHIDPDKPVLTILAEIEYSDDKALIAHAKTLKKTEKELKMPRRSGL